MVSKNIHKNNFHNNFRRVSTTLSQADLFGPEMRPDNLLLSKLGGNVNEEVSPNIQKLKSKKFITPFRKAIGAF